MREQIKEFVKMCTETLPLFEPVYEFGALQVPGQEGYADLRPLFPGKKYVGCDMRDGPGVDAILDLQNTELPPESVGTVLILDTLEHVELPRVAMEEVHRVLGAEGTTIIAAPMDYPIHSSPYDYWRFTPDGFRSLLKPFDSCFVDSAGPSNFPHTVVGIGFKHRPSEDRMREFLRSLQDWKARWRHPSGSRWNAFVNPFIPPIVHRICRKIRRLAS
jgi:hypothetical protein